MKGKKNWVSDFYDNVFKINNETISGKGTSYASGSLGTRRFHTFFEAASGIVCIYNFQTKQYEFISKNVTVILGHDPEDYLKGGLAFGVSTFHESHGKVFSSKILPLCLHHISVHAAAGDLENVSLDYSFKVRAKDGRHLWFLKQMNFIETDEQGYPILSIISMINIDSVKTDNFMTLKVSRKNEKDIFQPIFSQSFVVDEEFLFSERELEILQLLSEGKSSSEIADLLFISKHTVNTHRQNMLEKTSARNTIELLMFTKKRALITSQIIF